MHLFELTIKNVNISQPSDRSHIKWEQPCFRKIFFDTKKFLEWQHDLHPQAPEAWKDILTKSYPLVYALAVVKIMFRLSARWKTIVPCSILPGPGTNTNAKATKKMGCFVGHFGPAAVLCRGG
jgi:hypothetical protein